LNLEFVDYGSPVDNWFRYRTLPYGFADDIEVQQNVLNYFASFDDSIKGFEIEQIDSDKDETNEKYVSIDAMHRMIDSEQLTKIPLPEESAGTLKMFSLYPSLMEVLETGGILCIDELNARLHPLLVRNFILTFLDPARNPKHAQIIFTSHDTWQLSNNLLRRDEIWFVKKGEQGISELYSLAEFEDNEGVKIRKDEKYEKFNKLRIYFFNHCSEKWTLKKMSQLSDYSVSRFCNIYVSFFNVSPMNDLLDWRFEFAKHLILLNTHKISEIAEMCGFSSVHYFSRFFTERTGVSPKNYK